MPLVQHPQTLRRHHDLLPHIVDHLARKSPEDVYGLWPASTDGGEAGFRAITYAQLANVVNGLAWWLVHQLGRGSPNADVLTYVGPNDVRLTGLVLAAVKAGYVLFLTSPRNSPMAHQSLFGSLNCGTLITPDPTPTSALSILEAVKPRHLVIPGVEDLLNQVVLEFAYEKTIELAQWDPLFVIHTSGSTGIPKPLIWTHESWLCHDRLETLKPPDGVTSLDHYINGRRVISTLPQFHGAGLYQYLFGAIGYGTVVIAPVSDAIPTAQTLVDTLKQTPADVALLVPSVVADLAQSDELLDFCAAHLKLIVYIGGDLPQAIGDRVASKVRLRCQWGASEVGIPHQLMLEELSGPQDWRYVRFHPSLGAVFEEVGADGMHELVIRRHPDNEQASTQTTFSVRGQDQPEVKEYRTRDLFACHPTVPDAWDWRARADDIIVFLNGEKTNPISMEQHVVGKNGRLLSAAIVLGAQRLQAALLIEPVATVGRPMSTAERAAVIQEVWPSVEEANRVAPAHARIERSMILVTHPDRPLIRAGKGTIQRSASIALYATDIEELYANADAVALGSDDECAPAVDTTDTNAVASFIRSSVLSLVAEWAPSDPERNVVVANPSFFDSGMDSLQALRLTRILRRGLHRPDITLSTIYRHPSIEQLTSVILAQNPDESSQDPDEALAESLLRAYRELLNRIPPVVEVSRGSLKHGPMNVLLTGSTGSLGTFILAALLSRPDRVAHVFCLNRAPDGGRTKQTDRFSAAGLPMASLDDARVTFLHADFTHGPTLGLDADVSSLLRSRVSLIIHNAWLVNFNLNIAAFEPHIAGLVNIFSFASETTPPVKFVFISSVSAVGKISPGPAPEAIQTIKNSYPNGYARSKAIAEQICDVAAKYLGNSVTVLRVGQVAGAVGPPEAQAQGAVMEWNRAEWFPSLVISSLLRLGCLPDSLGAQFSTVDWIPGDLLADVVVDLAFTEDGNLPGPKAGAGLFNVRNPNTTTWTELLPAVVSFGRRLGRAIAVVSPSAWLTRLQESINNAELGAGADADVSGANPAAKLLDFYSLELSRTDLSWKPMGIERALAAGDTLREMPAVKSEWVSKWVDEWMKDVKEASAALDNA